MSSGDVQQSDPRMHRQWEGLLDFAQTCSENTYSDPTPERSAKLLRKLQTGLENNAAQLFRQLDLLSPAIRAAAAPVCKMGCDHCCYQNVAATIPEVLAVADHIRANFTEEEQQRVRSAAASNRAIFEADGDHLRHACPLLHDHMCTAHSARPFICRSFHSSSVDRCIFDRENPTAPPTATQVQPLFFPPIYMRSGLMLGLHYRNLDKRLVYLGPALDIALNDPDAGEKYFRGEDPFGPANKPTDENSFDDVVRNHPPKKPL